MTTMKTRMTLRAEVVERVHPLLELDRADSSWAVPSVASRSSSALTMPWTKRLARRSAMNATTTIRAIGRTVWRRNAADLGRRELEHCPRVAAVAQPERVPRRPVRVRPWRSPGCGAPLGSGAAEADRDGRRGLARLGGELRDAPRGQPERRAPDVDGGDDVAARVVDGAATALRPSSYSPIAVA